MNHNDKIKKGFADLHQKLAQEKNHVSLPVEDFFEKISENPKCSLRNIFQLLYDMIHHYVPEGHNEYPNDPQSINYIKYDTTDLLISNTDTPFFADRLLANRLINVIDSLKLGVLQNKMLAFIGPPGSGKSTFLNAFFEKLEAFTATRHGAMYETVWEIDTEKLGLPYIPNIVEQEALNLQSTLYSHKAEENQRLKDTTLIIPCPSHDHPIVQIPKEYRKDLLNTIIDDKEFKRKLFYHKEYEWVLTKTPCPICSSIFKALSEKLSTEEVLKMLHVRQYEFSRKLGEGLSVYNPGDMMEKLPLHNPELQRWIDSLFKSSNAVSYTYSRLAKTNNGIFAIMDAKSNNIDRLKNIHGIISDGIHKVETSEESINSLFMALINPEDLEVITEEKSFRDRVINIPIPYIRDYTTEVEIYRSSYGKKIDSEFMPRVITSFAKIVVSSRLNYKSEALHEWIEDPTTYSKVCDEKLLVLQMEIYSGKIPSWLNETDIQRLDRPIRRKIIREGETQGRHGFSGRESIELFNNLLLRYRRVNELITLADVIEFFSDQKYQEKIPKEFLDAIVRLYDYTTLQEVKEAMFFYNQEQIENEIKNYIFAITHDDGTEAESPYTNEMLTISKDYFLSIETRFLDGSPTENECQLFRDDQMRKYVAKTLHEIKSGIDICETDQFQALLDRYNHSLKEDVLAPFVKNDNFRRAIKEFSTDSFKNYDKRIRNEVTLLMNNLTAKFSYTEIGAQQACIYVIDKDLVNLY